MCFDKNFTFQCFLIFHVVQFSMIKCSQVVSFSIIQFLFQFVNSFFKVFLKKYFFIKIGEKMSKFHQRDLVKCTKGFFLYNTIGSFLGENPSAIFTRVLFYEFLNEKSGYYLPRSIPTAFPLAIILP